MFLIHKPFEKYFSVQQNQKMLCLEITLTDNTQVVELMSNRCFQYFFNRYFKFPCRPLQPQLFRHKHTKKASRAVSHILKIIEDRFIREKVEGSVVSYHILIISRQNGW